MMRFLHGNDLEEYPGLCRSMFRDRAEQFSRRLGWDVDVDRHGEERDEYDQLNPIYVIAETPTGQHEGSMRFLPTIGQTMLNDHFAHLTDGIRIAGPRVWECSRFCVGPGATRQTAAKLLAAGGKLMLENALKHYVGVFDGHMERVYRMLGASPTVLYRQKDDHGILGVGLWEFDSATYVRLLQKACITSTEMDAFYASSMDAREELRASA